MRKKWIFLTILVLIILYILIFQSDLNFNAKIISALVIPAVASIVINIYSNKIK